MIIDVKSEIGDPVERILCRINLNVFLGRVQDVRDPDLLQVREVLDRLSVRQADTRKNLVTINLHGLAFLPIGGAVESRHHTMLSGSGVDDGVDQFVAGALLVN